MKINKEPLEIDFDINFDINEHFFLHKSKCGLYQLSCLNGGCIFYLTEDELKGFPIDEVYIFKDNKVPAVKIKIDDVLHLKLNNKLNKLSDANNYTDDYTVNYNKVNNSIEEIIVSKNRSTFIHGIVLYVNNRKFIQILTNSFYKHNETYIIYNEQDFFAEIDFDKKIISCEYGNKLLIKNLSDEMINYFKTKFAEQN
jgi:hypothetical protein